jgi:hypothetical protein
VDVIVKIVTTVDFQTVPGGSVFGKKKLKRS